MNIKISGFFILIFIINIHCEPQCPDHRVDKADKHKWSFYYTDKPSNPVMDFSYDGGVVQKQQGITGDVFKHLFDKIHDMDDTKIFLYSEKDGSLDYAHHKSIVVLFGDKLETGFALISSYPDFHSSFLKNADVTMMDTQHMLCISLESAQDVQTLVTMYNWIKPNLQVMKYKGKVYSFTDKTQDDPDFGIDLPWKFTEDDQCKGGFNEMTDSSEPLDVTKELLDIDKAGDDNCFKTIENKIGDFKYYATVTQRKLKVPEGTRTVKDFGVDAWWKLTRILKEKLFIITHTATTKGLGSIYSKDVVLQNVIWDYDGKASEGHHHDKLAFSQTTNKFCIGDGNRDYTQSTRSALIGCIDNKNLRDHFFNRKRVYLDEEYIILDDSKDEDFFPNDASFQKSKRKLIHLLAPKIDKPKLRIKRKEPTKFEPEINNIFTKELTLRSGDTVTVEEALESFIIEPGKPAMNKETKNKFITPNRLHCVQHCLEGSLQKKTDYDTGFRLQCSTHAVKGGSCPSFVLDNFDLGVIEVTDQSIKEKLMELLRRLYTKGTLTDKQIIDRYEVSTVQTVVKKKKQ